MTAQQHTTGQVTIGPDFFRNIPSDYSNPSFALIRELFQNSRDANGCNTIRISYDSNTLVVENNGEPMTSDILLGLYRGFRKGPSLRERKTLNESTMKQHQKYNKDGQPRKQCRRVRTAPQVREQRPPDVLQEFPSPLAPTNSEILNADGGWLMNRYCFFSSWAGARSFGLNPDINLAMTRTIDKIRIDNPNIPPWFESFCRSDWLNRDDLVSMHSEDHAMRNIITLHAVCRNECELVDYLRRYILNNFDRGWQSSDGSMSLVKDHAGFQGAIRAGVAKAMTYRGRTPVQWVRRPGLRFLTTDAWSDDRGMYRLIPII